VAHISALFAIERKIRFWLGDEMQQNDVSTTRQLIARAQELRKHSEELIDSSIALCQQAQTLAGRQFSGSPPRFKLAHYSRKQ
jgi:hypothetical protein